MAKLFITLTFALAIVAAGIGFMAKSNIDKLQNSLKGSKDDLHREQGKLQAANNDLKKSGEDLAAANEKLKESAQTLESKIAELTAKGEQLATAQKETAAKTEEAATLKKMVDDGKLVAAELERAKVELLAATEKLVATEAERVKLADQVTALTVVDKVVDNAPKEKATRKDLTGLQGKVLAFNPGWNFVVLNVGDQQGVLVNAPLLVIRGNVPVARLRVTSVERATSVADVIPASTARGVTVQPGDTVIFEGRTSATELTKPMAETVLASPRL